MEKKVLVTGGAGGLGLAIVKKHLALGDQVWALDIAETPGLAELADMGEKVSFIRCDISKTANVQAALRDMAASIVRLDYLYSCAGIYRFEDKATLPGTNLDNAASMYEINAVGFVRVVQAVLPAIQDGCHILCVTSEAGSVGENWRDTEYNYCMSKAAQNMACALLRKHFEKQGQNTRVMCLHPGWVRSQIGGDASFKELDRSVAPEDSAEGIVGIALDIDSIPVERSYMDYQRKDIKW